LQSASGKTALLEALKKPRAKSLKGLSLGEFIPAVSPTFTTPVHLRPLLRVFERIAAGEEVRACVSVPPRHAKTETVLHGAAWLIARSPRFRVGYASYTASIAFAKSRAARDYTISAGVGGMLATGRGGALTGHGVDLLIVDDPFKNRSEADSPTIRESCFNWYTSTARTRLEPGGSIIITHTRWHPHDLIGRLKAAELGYEHIVLPAIDLDGRSLWSERYDLPALHAIREEVGDYDWQSLFMQDPVARKGLVYEMFSSAHVVDPEDVPKAFRRVVVGIDFGMRHPGVMLVLGETGTGELWVVHEEVHQNKLFAEKDTGGGEGWLAIAKRLRNTYRPERFVADPSQPNLILTLRQFLDGNPVVMNAQNDISEGIRRVSVELNGHLCPDGKLRPRLRISRACKHLISEMQTWSYRVINGIPSEIPSDVGDDACDALRYAVMAVTKPVKHD